MTKDIVEKATKRFEELSLIIKKADEVRDEYTRLQNLMVLLSQVSESLSGTPNNDSDEPPAPVEHQNGHANGHHRDPSTFNLTAPVTGNLSIPDRAERILRQRGPLHLSELFKEMRNQGWKATGDDAKDKRNLAASLWTRKGDRFSNIGNNTWQIIPKKGDAGKMPSAN